MRLTARARVALAAVVVAVVGTLSLLIPIDDADLASVGAIRSRLRGARPPADERRGRALSPAALDFTLETVDSKASPGGGAAVKWWEDIDYGQPMACGRQKCYFVSLRDPARGYLVWRPRRGDAADIGYALSEELEGEGARHFLAGPPTVEDPPPRAFQDGLTGEYVARLDLSGGSSPWFGRSQLAVQPCRTWPPGTLLVKCRGKPSQRIAYVKQLLERGASGRVLAEELRGARDLLEAHPALATDFQLAIDKMGFVYQIDVDRVAMMTPVGQRQIAKVQSCLAHLIELSTEAAERQGT